MRRQPSPLTRPRSMSFRVLSGNRPRSVPAIWSKSSKRAAMVPYGCSMLVNCSKSKCRPCGNPSWRHNSQSSACSKKSRLYIIYTLYDNHLLFSVICRSKKYIWPLYGFVYFINLLDLLINLDSDTACSRSLSLLIYPICRQTCVTILQNRRALYASLLWILNLIE